MSKYSTEFSKEMFTDYSNIPVPLKPFIPEVDKEPLKLDLNDCQIEDLTGMLPLRQCVGLVFKSNIRY